MYVYDYLLFLRNFILPITFVVEIWKHNTDFSINVHCCFLLLILLKRYTNADLPKFEKYAKGSHYNNFTYHYLLQKVRSFSFNGWLGSQAVTFEFLKINKNLFSHVIMLYFQRRVIFFLYNQKIWSRSYFKEKNALEFSNKALLITLKYNKKNHASSLALHV